jgi:hypothetical protein
VGEEDKEAEGDERVIHEGIESGGQMIRKRLWRWQENGGRKK